MKKYELIWNEEEMLLKRNNDGFNPLELLGILEITLQSIKDQMTGKETTPIKTIKNIIEK